MAVNAVFPTCKKCHRVYLGALSEHACPPQFRVWNPDEGQTLEEDARTIFANDAEDAVEKWAEDDDNDSAEYSIAKGTPAVVCVQRYNAKDEPEGPVERYRVEGYYDPCYIVEAIQ
jgi:hypothetical protein